MSNSFFITKNSQKKQSLSSSQTIRRNIQENSFPVGSTAIDISKSTIKSLAFLQRYGRLCSVNAANTLVSSLEGVMLQRSLTIIQMEGSPFSKYKYYRIMLLISFGLQISSIDYRTVSQAERNVASRLQIVMQSYLYDGWILNTREPLSITRGSETKIITEKEIDQKIQSPRAIRRIKMAQTQTRIKRSTCDLNRIKEEDSEMLDYDSLMEAEKIDEIHLLSHTLPARLRDDVRRKPPNPKHNKFNKAFSTYVSNDESYLDKSQELGQTRTNISTSFNNKRAYSQPISPVHDVHEEVMLPAINNTFDASVDEIFSLAQDIVKPNLSDNTRKKISSMIDSDSFPIYNQQDSYSIQEEEFSEEEEEYSEVELESVETQTIIDDNVDSSVKSRDVEEESIKEEMIYNESDN